MMNGRSIAYVTAVCVAAVVIAGFFVIDSPARERMARFDERRLRDLEGLQSQVTAYFNAKGKLPTALDEIAGFEGFSVPRDPETGNAYEYRPEGERIFRLCAEFDLESEAQQRREYMPYPDVLESWRHPAGRSCFELTIEDGSGERIPPPVTVKPVQ